MTMIHCVEWEDDNTATGVAREYFANKADAVAARRAHLVRLRKWWEEKKRERDEEFDGEGLIPPRPTRDDVTLKAVSFETSCSKADAARIANAVYPL